MGKNPEWSALLNFHKRYSLYRDWRFLLECAVAETA
jgi:hypothetical protein